MDMECKWNVSKKNKSQNGSFWYHYDTKT